MDFELLSISKNQADELARIIFADVDDYVNNHLCEFDEYLKREECEAKT